MAGIALQVQGICHTALQGVRQEMEGTLQKLMAPSERRLDYMETDLRKFQKEQQRQEREQKDIRNELERMQKVLNVAEAQLPAIDAAKLAEWDREPSPCVFTAGSATSVTASEVKRSIAEWVADANLDMSEIHFHGEAAPNRRHIFEVRAGAGSQAKAIQLAAALRLRGGRWRRFQCIDTQGATNPLFVGPDKSAKQIRKEVQTKRMQTLLENAHPGHTWKCIRAKGIVTIDSVPLVELIPQGPSEPTRLLWNPQAASYNIDVDAIAKQFNDLFRSFEVDTSNWISTSRYQAQYQYQVYHYM
ncbi:unnamed protein product, partial [Prorocentrum cordatum]